MSKLKNRACSLSATLRRLALATAMSVLCTLAIANPPCPSDLDGDGMVTAGDISLVLLDFGACPVDPPSISSVTPNFGPTAGGTTITITGMALTDTSIVTVRGNSATSVIVVNDTTVTAVTPAGSVGAANVQVTTPGGTATISGAFTYGNAPPPAWCTVLEQSPNATVVPDATLRAAIIATNLPWRVRDTGTGIEMVLIPPGTYIMGCSASNSFGCNGDETQHQVTLTNAFYLSRTEVTQAQWLAKMGSNPSHFTGDSSRPVEQVSWNDIQSFCTNNGLRLPTEAEWEYAYRAGTTTAFHGMPGYLNGTNDDTQLGTIAWISSNSGNQTRPVAGKAANGFGLCDMSGNVWEWCQDWYGTYASGAQTNPTGPGSGGVRVFRGGAWYDNSLTCRASERYGKSPDTRLDNVGFRVARTP
ncbi:MAG: SUMF1/EgtB/PvdO family nonheme iron enzyme [Actinomycetales bacterium]|nr:SUMF1/EgtB/PvdO family nonheme iron enzyme [Actinomycetales bacterium]